MEPFEKRGQFEQAFSLAFDGAEIAPDPHVWDKIDAGLAKSASSSYKKRLFVFQLVAAASLLFAASVTLFQVFRSDDITTGSDGTLTESSTELLEGTPESKDVQNEVLAETSKPGNERSTSAITEDTKIDESEQAIIGSDKLSNLTPEDIDNNIRGIRAVTLETDDDPILVDDMSQHTTATSISYLLSIEPKDEDVFREFPEFNPEFIPIWTKYESDESKSDMWASAGFAAGSYNASSGMGLSFASADDFTEAAPSLDQASGLAIYSNEESGRSVGGGVGLGARIGRKWNIESGLNYLHSEIDGTTNSVIESDGRVYPVFYETSFAGTLQNTSDFGVTSSFDFINIPFKAGYVLVDKKIGWVATGGFGSSFLINNSLDSQMGQFEKINYSISDSPYRRISWSGIIGTEVYFNITEDYQLLVVPQYNFGITEITKQESSFRIVPNSFNLGLRLRYLLK